MRKIVTTFLLLLLCSFFAMANAKNFAGTLTVYIGDQPSTSQSTVVVETDANGTAVLKISGFKIADFSALNITFNSTWIDNQLSTPATVKGDMVTNLLLGNISILTEGKLGELDDTNCKVDVRLYAAKLQKEVRVVFQGSAE